MTMRGVLEEQLGVDEEETSSEEEDDEVAPPLPSAAQEHLAAMTSQLAPDSLIPALRDPIAKLVAAKGADIRSAAASGTPKHGAGSVGSGKPSAPGSLLTSNDGPPGNTTGIG